MDSYSESAKPKKRQRQQVEGAQPSKRQRISTKEQQPRRRRTRSNVGTYGYSEQARSSAVGTGEAVTPRKRVCETEEPPVVAPLISLSETAHASEDLVTVGPADSRTHSDPAEIILNPIDYWRRKGTWPKAFSESHPMHRLLATKRSTPSLRRKRSGSLASSTPSDQKPREEKSAQYRDVRYETLLETAGSFMDTAEQGITDASKAQIRTLLQKDQAVPQLSLFGDDVFEAACRKIRNRNETRVIRDISQLIVPSAETLATCGDTDLEILIESTNDGWNNSIPVTGSRPQPDYSVGFRKQAFSEEQHEKLAPMIGNVVRGDMSYVMATYYMYFPFFACEVKCGAAALDIADRQNAHSMTLAVRAVVEVFRLVHREKEINREILAFSVSHDHRSVRIYGHYAVIDGSKISFHRHPIRTFDFTELDGKEKWTAYKFTKSVYDTWLPMHYKRLCSAIDQLPSVESSDVQSTQQESGLSQDLGSHQLSESSTRSVLRVDDDESQASRTTTPDTSFTEQGASKRQKEKSIW